MEYTVIVGGKSYALPKKTLTVMERLDEALKVDRVKGLSVRQKFEKLHGFMKDTVGEEKCREMFGSDDLEEIDLSELAVTVRKVLDAYERPVRDYDIEQGKNQLNRLPLEKIISMASAAEKMAGNR